MLYESCPYGRHGEAQHQDPKRGGFFLPVTTFLTALRVLCYLRVKWFDVYGYFMSIFCGVKESLALEFSGIVWGEGG